MSAASAVQARESIATAGADPWKRVEELGGELTVELPLPKCTARKFLAMARGSVLPSGWKVGSEVPLRLNGTVIAWCDFEVVFDHLAVRITELG